VTSGNTNVSTPRVTVAVPTRNRAELLDEALTRIRAQTYTDIEILVCDNASTDKTSAVVEQHANADERVRYQRNADDIGAQKNFELGLLLARGDYFAWAADDDHWEPTLLTTLVSVLEQRKDVMLACAEAQYMLEDGTPCPFVREGPAFAVDAVPRRLADRLRAIATSNYGNLIYGLFRRTALLRRDRRQNSVGTVFSVYGVDSALNEIPVLLQIAAFGEIAVVPEPLWFKRTSAAVYHSAVDETLSREAGLHQPWRSFLLFRPRAWPTPRSTKRALVTVARDLPGQWSYHRTTMLEIQRTLSSLPIERALRHSLVWTFRRRLYGHLAEFEWRKIVHTIDAAAQARARGT
jgi:glycosyltransferase involved in cell wall biosynthesis